MRDRLSSSSDLLKSWGGVWRSRVEYVCRVVYLWCTVCYCPCHLYAENARAFCSLLIEWTFGVDGRLIFCYVNINGNIA